MSSRKKKMSVANALHLQPQGIFHCLFYRCGIPSNLHKENLVSRTYKYKQERRKQIFLDQEMVGGRLKWVVDPAYFRVILNNKISPTSLCRFMEIM